MSPENISLLPHPKHLRLTGGFSERRCAPGGGGAIFQAADDLPPEGYAISVSRHMIEVRYADTPGRRYALATLEQLRVNYPDGLFPCLEINDFPDLALRGVMLDVTRGRMGTMEHFRATLRTLASWKINHVQLYLEHAFASRGNEAIWEGWSPLTANEVAKLDAFARECGIELSFCQNSFGHMTLLLSHEKYRHLAEIPPGARFESWGMQSTVPQSFCPLSDGVFDWLDALYAELLNAYSSPLVNIGCDETLDLGCGRSAQTVREKGIETVFADYVKKICRLTAKYGKVPALWADFPLNHPDVIAMLPENLLFMAWGYDADTPFDRWGSIFADRKRNFLFAPGSCCWSSFFGNPERRGKNIAAAANAAIRHGARGIITTDWGDGGHRQLWPFSLHALAEGAAKAWNAGAEFSPEDAGLFAFGSAEAGKWMAETARVDTILQHRGLGTLYADLHANIFTFREKDGGDIEYAQALNFLESQEADIPGNIPEIIRDEFKISISLAKIAAERAVLRRRGELWKLKRLGEKLSALMPEYRRLWLKRSRPGGLENAVAKYESTADEMKRIF